MPGQKPLQVEISYTVGLYRRNLISETEAIRWLVESHVGRKVPFNMREARDYLEHWNISGHYMPPGRKQRGV